jgi:FkbM family methyltransferase
MPVPKQEGKIRLANGCIMFYPPGYQELAVFLGGVYEPEASTVRLLMGFLRPGMRFVDVGAHLGYYTLLASQLVGPSGRVYAFEPDPHFFPYLVRNIEANGRNNVVAVPKAVADRTGTMTLFSQPTSSGSSLYHKGAGLREEIVVEVTSLDAFFAKEGWPPIDMVKLDIEGGEKAALEGMVELSRRNPGLKLIVEFELRAMRAAGTAPEELVSTLQRLGFTKFHVVNGEPAAIELPDGLGILVSKARRRLYVNLFCEKEPG